jgi:FecR protein
MSERDDYLWDPSGEPDADVERLEELLAPLAYEPGPSEVDGPGERREAWGLRGLPRVVLFAAGLAAAAALALWIDTSASQRATGAPEIELLVGGQRLERGELIEAAAGLRTRLQMAEIGELSLSPGTRLRAKQLDAREVILELERGSLSAYVSPSAAPGFFNIDTPATRCVDLGCAYELRVDEDGETFVEVTLGRVAFRNGDGEVFVPAGAVCHATAAGGAGTPHFRESPEEWLRELRLFDLLDVDDVAREAKGAALVRGATSKNELLPLWHLTADESDAVARAAAGRMGELHPDLSGFDEKGRVALSAKRRASWREELWPDPYAD